MNGKQELARLRRKMALTRCADCGEPYDIMPCNTHHARIQQDRLRVTPSLAVSLRAILNRPRV